MSRKPHIHAEVIKAWADGAEIEVFNVFYPGGRWQATSVPPKFEPSYEFRVKPAPDPYAELRQALREGKKIEYQSQFDGEWSEISVVNPDRKFLHGPERYRVKPEPVVCHTLTEVENPRLLLTARLFCTWTDGVLTKAEVDSFTHAGNFTRVL
jgi:hypothetical protein